MVCALQHHMEWTFEELHIQIDGGSENWNKIAFMLGPILLERYDKLALVTYNRMGVGHTKNDLDQKFSIPYEYVQGRKLAGSNGRSVLGHTEYVQCLKDAFAAAEDEQARKATANVKKRRSRVRHGKTAAQLEEEREAYTRCLEPMTYAPLYQNFDVMSILKQYISPQFAGYGPQRNQVLKEAGLEGCHVIQFYRGQTEGSIHWRYKQSMSCQSAVEGGDVYNTILTEDGSGEWADKSAREVIIGLGAATILPEMEPPKKGFFLDRCTCGVVAPQKCKCQCAYFKFKDALRKKLQACTNLDPAHVERAKQDWESHLAKWDDHVEFLQENEPTWAFPPGADTSREEKQAEAEAANEEENQRAIAAAESVLVTHARNPRRVRRQAIAEAEAVVRSNNDGFRDGEIPELLENTFVVLQSPDDSGVPFYIGKLKEATQPDQGGDHEILVQWWTAETTSDEWRGVYCYQGPVWLKPCVVLCL